MTYAEEMFSRIQDENRFLKQRVKELEKQLLSMNQKITVKSYKSVHNLDGTTTLIFDELIEHVGYSPEQCGREK